MWYSRLHENILHTEIQCKDGMVLLRTSLALLAASSDQRQLVTTKLLQTKEKCVPEDASCAIENKLTVKSIAKRITEVLNDDTLIILHEMNM